MNKNECDDPINCYSDRKSRRECNQVKRRSFVNLMPRSSYIAHRHKRLEQGILPKQYVRQRREARVVGGKCHPQKEKSNQRTNHRS